MESHGIRDGHHINDRTVTFRTPVAAASRARMPRNLATSSTPGLVFHISDLERGLSGTAHHRADLLACPISRRADGSSG
jgi:hypothetical protein